MPELGFVHDLMDVKILILFVAARAARPLTSQEIFALCSRNEYLSYFEVCAAIPELVASGHLAQTGEHYAITEKGRSDGELTEGSLIYSVRKDAEDAVDRFNRQSQRTDQIKTQILPRENGEYAVRLRLESKEGPLMAAELYASDLRRAADLEKRLAAKAEEIYSLTIASLLDEEEEETGES